MTYTKDSISERLALDFNVTKKEARKIVDVVFGSVSDALADGQDVTIHGFGTFSVKATAERTGRNPQNGEAITIPAGKKVAFKAAKALKTAL